MRTARSLQRSCRAISAGLAKVPAIDLCRREARDREVEGHNIPA
jgi:hypothetical protein